MASIQKVIGLSAVLSLCIASASAQGIDIGQREFNSHCAFCHGLQGKGDGPSANMLRTKVADLSVLQKNNKDIFPFKRTYEVIDGRETVAAHGPRDMPVWGDVYTREAADWNLPPGINQDAFVRARILSLVEYISRLQQK
ncbi:MAG: c-type cytochrome [Pseudolabrys sp.]